MVLGAGRGPLVNASMRAAKETGRCVVDVSWHLILHALSAASVFLEVLILNRKLRLFALEKNPNAVNTLLNLKHNNPDWKDVTVISTDIRKYSGDIKADVIVSELLGSFGDNELSPECLYGAEDLLKRKHLCFTLRFIPPFALSLVTTREFCRL